MKAPGARRLALVAGWLLTPLVAWAASFLAGWLGAVIGERASRGSGGFLWLGGGALLGAVAGVAGWVAVLRWAGRQPGGSPRPHPGTSDTGPSLTDRS